MCFQLLVFSFSALFHAALAAPSNSWDGQTGHGAHNHKIAFRPTSLALGEGPILQTSTFHPFTLNLSTPFATIDYGQERAGYPFFVVSALGGGCAQVEVKYSEPFTGLAQPFADGPYAFSNGLSNTYRVETLNITGPGVYSPFLLQGGQRWQSIRLLTQGSISFSQVGLRPSISTTEVENLPGSFDSDDDTLNAIWKLGARAATAACVDKGTQGPAWRVDPENGVLVESYRPALSLEADTFANYTLTFQTKIGRGGCHWGLAWPVAYGSGIQLGLIANPTFLNTNKTLTPPNSVMLGYGYDFVNQTTLPAWYLDTFTVPFIVNEQQWYNISTVIGQNRLSVAIDGISIFSASLADYYVGGAPIGVTGSFGFGVLQDQAAYVRNVNVYDTANGSLIYANSMTASDVLAEYGTQANLASVCLDGPKRDRLVWLGDFYHTARIIGVSTTRFDQAQGTVAFALDSQTPLGLLNFDPAMGYDPTQIGPFELGADFGLNDYQILFFLSFYEYVRSSNDLAFARSTWPKWQKQLSWLQSSVNVTDGLVHVPSAFLGPGGGGSAVSCAAVQALNSAAIIATTLGDATSAANYTSTATSLGTAINNKLWNEQLGVYSTSVDNLTDYSVAGIAFCITSNVSHSIPSGNRTQRSLAALENLKLGPGYKDSTQVSNADPTVNISPNTNGFLLSALFQGGAYTTGGKLIRSLWGTMLEDPETTTGASWEYVRASDSKPGLDLFTSLSHPWGGAATYVLTEWAAGLRAAEGSAGFGWREWLVDPTAGVEMGLKRASATVVTASGGDLVVRWSIKGGKINVYVKAPRATSGTFVFAGKEKKLNGKSAYAFSVDL